MATGPHNATGSHSKQLASMWPPDTCVLNGTSIGSIFDLLEPVIFWILESYLQLLRKHENRTGKGRLLYISLEFAI